MKCPKDNNKQYIIPTTKWLTPIKPLLLEDINTSGLIMVAKLIEKEKVIVKITQDKRDNIININKITKDMPNFIETYCSFSCLENSDDLDKKYENIKGFCNAKAKNSGKLITLEIMKKYKNGSLNKYKNKLELDHVVNILKQLLLSQLHTFNKTGFLHNDIHLSNILIEKLKEPITLKYKIDIKPISKYRIKINSDFIPIISDFDRSTIYNGGDLTEEEYNNQYTLGDNIFNTFNRCLILIKDQDKQDLVRKKLINQSTEIEKYVGFSKKNLRTYFKQNYDYNDYISEECKCMLTLSSRLINLLEEHTTNEWFGI